MKKKLLIALTVLMMFTGVRANADDSVTTSENIVVQVADYKDFTRAINDTNVAGIEVVGDITATDNLGTISRAIELYGKNITIDGNGKNGLIFSSVPTTSSPIIDGAINFINFNSERGAVIYNQDSTIITYIEGIFKNNTATKFGGAIYNDRVSKIDSIQGTFENNTAGMDGGAIHNGGTISSIANSTFKNNTATNDDGGAIHNSGTITSIEDGTFEKNKAADKGGAIFNSTNSTINSIANSKFENNTSNYGGAIYNDRVSKIDSIQGTFKNNKATNTGGAIYNEGIINSITGAFTENTAPSDGGAIYNLSAIDSIQGTFSGNAATYGGAIYNVGQIKSITNSTFEKNNANTGGAIFNYIKIDSITGAFTENTATTDGGAIYNMGTMDSIQGTFKNNTATNYNGGAIYNEDTINSIANSTFENNIATGNGGAIYNNVYSTIGSIVADFTDNKTTRGCGGAISNDSTIGSIQGTFKNNTAESHGGAIDNEGTIGSIIEGTFTNNTATDGNGGAIYNYNGGTITSIVADFTNNTANSITSTTGNGGAIYNESTINSIQGTFENNTASKAGGAIYNEGTINIVADTQDTTFTGNTANGISNALYNNAGTTNLNASGNHKIVFNDGIDGEASSLSNTIYINNTNGSLPTNGIVEFNNTVKNNTVKLYNGTLHLGSNTQNETTYYGNFEDATLELLGGTLDTIGDSIRNYTLGKITGTGTNFALDVDLVHFNSDNFTIANGSSATINIGEMNHLNLINAGHNGIEIFKGTTDNLIINPFAIFTKDTKINFTQYSTQKGYIDCEATTGTYTLIDAVEYALGNRQYEVSGTETLDEDLGSMRGDNSSLVIKGNSAESDIVDGNNNAGLTVNSGQKLSIKNVGFKNFNTTTSGGGVINNHGTVEIIKDSTFENNESINKGSAIYNDTNCTINSIVADFTKNIAYGGGAIANAGTIDSIAGTFTRNETRAGGSGAAIYNSNKITEISGKFTDNSANLYGGAIHNSGTITSIVADFTGNNVTNYDGGAIYNEGTINSIQGTFTKNTAYQGGAISNSDTIDSIVADFTNNTTDHIGGAIYNYNGGTIDSIVADFTNNTATYQGGAIFNSGTIDSIVATFTNNKTTTTMDLGGGAISNDGTITSIVADFTNNTAYGEGSGGAIYNENGGKINSIQGTFTKNTAYQGGAISNSGTIDSIVADFTNNTAKSLGGAIFNCGTINIVADTQDTTFTGNTANGISNALYNNDGTIYLNASGNHKIVFNDGIDGDPYFSNTIYINNTNGSLPTNGIVAINNEVKNNTVNLYNGTLNLGVNTQNGRTYSGTFDDSVNFNYEGGTVSLQNGIVNSANLGNLYLNADMDLKLEADFAQLKMDSITVSGFDSRGYNINISDLIINNPIEEKAFSLSPIGEMADATLKSSLAGAIQYTGSSTINTPIYKYGVEYDPTTAMMNFSLAGGGNSVSDFNPAILATPVATQLGGYLTQLNTYEQAFANQDMLMSLTNEQRTALKFANKLASTQGTGAGGVVTFSPNQIPEQDKGLWFRPFTTFENVGLKNGPNVKNIGYGSLFGGDSDIIELKNGWDMVYSFYAGYNGSNQYYDGVSITQNGGTLGASGTLYKGNFFTGLTANVGASAGQANTMYGSDDFAMLMTGVASKTGYNWELASGKFIIQPSFLISYSFVNTFDYTNGAGVKISSDPLHAIQIAPGLKFIGNLKNGWQPYISLQMVWNIMDRARFSANNVSLPSMSVDPYFQYGIGVQKRIGDRFTGFGQAMLRNGGRNGIALSVGLRWALGK